MKGLVPRSEAGAFLKLVNRWPKNAYRIHSIPAAHRKLKKIRACTGEQYFSPAYLFPRSIFMSNPARSNYPYERNVALSHIALIRGLRAGCAHRHVARATRLER